MRAASRLILDSAAVSQLEAQLDWSQGQIIPNLARQVSGAFTKPQRRRLTALGFRLSASRDLLGRQFSLPGGYKALLQNRSRASLELAAAWVAKVAGLKLVIKELFDFEDSDDDFGARRSVPKLEGPLEAAAQSGSLPALTVHSWDFEKDQMPPLVRQFMAFRGPGLLLYTEDSRKRPALNPGPHESISLSSRGSLALKGFDAKASGIQIEDDAIAFVEEHARDFEEAIQILRSGLVHAAALGRPVLGGSIAREAYDLYVQGHERGGELLFPVRGGK